MFKISKFLFWIQNAPKTVLVVCIIVVATAFSLNRENIIWKNGTPLHLANKHNLSVKIRKKIPHILHFTFLYVLCFFVVRFFEANFLWHLTANTFIWWKWTSFYFSFFVPFLYVFIVSFFLVVCCLCELCAARKINISFGIFCME